MRAGNCIAGLVLGLLIAVSAHADYKDSYGRGLNAVKSGDWAEVRQRMQEAIADRAEPAERVRLYGQRWDPYVPQYYLGLAAFKLGDCATALAQWRSPANLRVIGSLSDLNADQQRDQANCETRLAQQTTPVKPSVPPDTPKTGTAPTVPPKPVPPPPKPVPTRPEPERPLPAPTPIAARVPAPLLAAYKDWLAGRYADVARINPDSYGDARAKTQAFLVRAAARHLQALLEGSDTLLDSARADIRAARALDARLNPDAALFSPRFRSFFAATR